MATTDTVISGVRKYRKVAGIIGLVASPWILIMIAIVLVVMLVVLLINIPFLLFADEERLSYTYSGSEIVWNAPSQLDVDGSEYAWPVPSISRISSKFGYRSLDGGEFHKGIDIANGPQNTELQPVYAIAAGIVTIAGPVSGYGQAVYIQHQGGLLSKYGHLDSRMDVRPGDIVNKGQRIGRIGQGKVGHSTGPHLHLQIELNGQPVDPENYVRFADLNLNGPNVPVELSYKTMNIEAVKSYLDKRNSALADYGILQMIDRAGKAKNVDPRLLIAITGQEQSYVPKSNRHAAEIIKNPWNVFGCWCKGKGSTLTTEQAATIAAATIVKLSQDRPPNRDPIEWLSTTDNPRGFYAEHSGWWIGVSRNLKAIIAYGG